MKKYPKRSSNSVIGKVPLERALSKLGIASRTQAREWIKNGRVSVNGVLRENPSFLVTPETVRLEIDGNRVEKSSWRTVLLHKPKSVITTRSDEKGRPTVFSLLQDESANLHAVGRLDWATTGLLILTNDTRLSSWLTDPLNEIPRIYLVTVRGELTSHQAIQVQDGIEDEGEFLRADEVQILKTSGKESHLIIRLSEGKNREIRRLFASLNHEVTRLKRVSYGGLELGNLAPGEYRELTRQEIQSAFPSAPLRSD